MTDELRDELAEVIAGHTPDLIHEGPNGEDGGKHWYCVECGVLANPEPSYGGEHVADALLPLIREHVVAERETKSVVHECCEARQTAEVELERLRTMTGMADAAGARILDERNEALSAIEQVRALVADVYAFNQLPEGHIHGGRDHIGSAVCLAMKITSALDGSETP